MITTNATDNETMAQKKELTDLTVELMRSMCRGIAFGQDAIMATSNLADIQTVIILLILYSAVNLIFDGRR